MAVASIREAQNYLKFLTFLKEIPKSPFLCLYDAEADLLYIDFYNPPKLADDSELTDRDIIIRYKGDEIVGLTVLDASKQTIAT